MRSRPGVSEPAQERSAARRRFSTIDGVAQLQSRRHQLQRVSDQLTFNL
jgi:hypothetical protein